LTFFESLPPEGFTTRFAPAPTGLLHLGHLTSALAVWGLARAFGGRVLLRVEDHDRSRSRAEFEAAILTDLEWLGLRPDRPFVRQSDRGPLYEDALRKLEEASLAYPCACSRRKVESEAGTVEGERRYPGTCRELNPDGKVVARRVRLERQPQIFRDLGRGRVEQIPSEQSGDVLIRDRHGQWTYQFAVVVDDLDQGIDLVIRGEDLLASTGRQIQIGRLLGRKTPPLFLHHPLVMREDGVKLSKANGDTGLRERRAAGERPEDLLGQAAHALGLSGPGPISFSEVVGLIRGWAARRGRLSEVPLVH